MFTDQKLMLKDVFAACVTSAAAGDPDYNLDIDAPLVHHSNLRQRLEREQMLSTDSAHVILQQTATAVLVAEHGSLAYAVYVHESQAEHIWQCLQPTVPAATML
jgi:hypothetical protein